MTTSNLKYFKNLSASFKDALKDVAGSQLPAIKEFKEANPALIAQKNLMSVKTVKNLYKDMKKRLNDNVIVKEAKNSLNNALKDIKSGKIYNAQRAQKNIDKAMGSFMGGDDGFNFNDFNMDNNDSFNFEDSSATNMNKKDNYNITQNMNKNFFTNAPTFNISSGAEALVSGLKQSNEINYRLTVAGIENSNKNSLLQMSFQRNIHEEMMASLRPIADNVATMATFFNEKSETISKLDKYIESSLAYQVDMLALTREHVEMYKKEYEIRNKQYEEEEKRTQYDSVHSGGGGMSLKNYFNAIKKNAFGILDEKMGGGLSFLSDKEMIGMMASDFSSNPLGKTMGAIMRAAIPLGFTSYMGFFNNMLSTVGMALNKKFKTMASSDSGFMRLLGRLFKLDMGEDSSGEFDFSNYKKDAVAFDGRTRRAIIEVIPGYLSRIYQVLARTSERLYFDYDKNKFVSDKDVLKDYKQEKDNILTNASAEIREFLTNIVETTGGNLNNNEREEYRKITAILGKALVEKSKNGLLDLRNVKIEDLDDILKNMIGNDDIYNASRGNISNVISGMNKSVSKDTGFSRMINMMFQAASDAAIRGEADLRKNITSQEGLDKIYAQVLKDNPQYFQSAKYISGKQLNDFSRFYQIENGITNDRGANAQLVKNLRMSGIGRRLGINKETDKISRAQFERLLRETYGDNKSVISAYEKFMNQGESNQLGTSKLKNLDIDSQALNEYMKTGKGIYDLDSSDPAGKFFKGARNFFSNPFRMIQKGFESIDKSMYKLIFGGTKSEEVRDENGNVIGVKEVENKGGLVENMFNRVEAIFTKGWNKIKGLFNKFFNFMHETIFKPIGEKIKELFTPVRQFFDDYIIGPLKKKSKEILNTIKNSAKGFLFGTFDDNGNMLTPGLFTPITSSIKSAFSGMKEAAKSLTNQLKSKANNFLEDLFGGKEKFDQAKAKVKGAAKTTGVGYLLGFFLPGGFITGSILSFGYKYMKKTGMLNELLFGGPGAMGKLRSKFVSGLNTVWKKFKSTKGSFINKIGSIATASMTGYGLGLVTSMFLPVSPFMTSILGGLTQFSSHIGETSEALFGKEKKDKFKSIASKVFNFKSLQTLLKSPRVMMAYLAGKALGGFFFGPLGGFLGSIMGSVASMATESKELKEKLFGTDDKKGLVSKNAINLFKRFLPKAGMASLGFKVGSILSMFTGWGLMGNIAASLVGIGISNTSIFKRFLFGTYDPESKTGKLGFAQKLFMKVEASLLRPISIFARSAFGQLYTAIDKNFIVPFKRFNRSLFLGAKVLFRKFIVDGIGKWFKEKIYKTAIKPFSDVFKKHLIDPMKKMFGGFFRLLFKAVLLPFRGIGAFFRGTSNLIDAQVTKSGYYANELQANKKLAEKEEAKGSLRARILNRAIRNANFTDMMAINNYNAELEADKFRTHNANINEPEVAEGYVGSLWNRLWGKKKKSGTEGTSIEEQQVEVSKDSNENIQSINEDGKKRNLLIQSIKEKFENYAEKSTKFFENMSKYFTIKSKQAERNQRNAGRGIRNAFSEVSLDSNGNMIENVANIASISGKKCKKSKGLKKISIKGKISETIFGDATMDDVPSEVLEIRRLNTKMESHLSIISKDVEKIAYNKDGKAGIFSRLFGRGAIGRFFSKVFSPFVKAWQTGKKVYDIITSPVKVVKSIYNATKEGTKEILKWTGNLIKNVVKYTVSGIAKLLWKSMAFLAKATGNLAYYTISGLSKGLVWSIEKISNGIGHLTNFFTSVGPHILQGLKNISTLGATIIKGLSIGFVELIKGISKITWAVAKGAWFITKEVGILAAKGAISILRGTGNFLRSKAFSVWNKFSDSKVGQALGMQRVLDAQKVFVVGGTLDNVRNLEAFGLKGSDIESNTDNRYKNISKEEFAEITGRAGFRTNADMDIGESAKEQVEEKKQGKLTSVLEKIADRLDQGALGLEGVVNGRKDNRKKEGKSILDTLMGGLGNILGGAKNLFGSFGGMLKLGGAAWGISSGMSDLKQSWDDVVKAFQEGSADSGMSALENLASGTMKSGLGMLMVAPKIGLPIFLGGLALYGGLWIGRLVHDKLIKPLLDKWNNFKDGIIEKRDEILYGKRRDEQNNLDSREIEEELRSLEDGLIGKDLPLEERLAKFDTYMHNMIKVHIMDGTISSKSVREYARISNNIRTEMILKSKEGKGWFGMSDIGEALSKAYKEKNTVEILENLYGDQYRESQLKHGKKLETGGPDLLGALPDKCNNNSLFPAVDQAINQNQINQLETIKTPPTPYSNTNNKIEVSVFNKNYEEDKSVESGTYNDKLAKSVFGQNDIQQQQAEPTKKVAPKNLFELITPETPNKSYVTSKMGMRTLFGKTKFHRGIDVGGVGYNTKIGAAMSGQVVDSRVSRGYGNIELIKHDGGLYTLYAHLSKRLAPKGTRVNAGDIIGISGNTGVGTGPHLHFEVTKKPFGDPSNFYDPLQFFNSGKLSSLDISQRVSGNYGMANAGRKSTNENESGATMLSGISGIEGLLRSIFGNEAYEFISRYYGGMFGLSSSGSDVDTKGMDGRTAASFTSNDISNSPAIQEALSRVYNETDINRVKEDMKLNSDKKRNFIYPLIPYALNAYNSSKLLPSIALSQAALESSWGDSGLAKEGNNYYGITAGKSFKGTPYINKRTGYKFKTYANKGESLADYVALLNKDRYKKVLAADNFADAAKELTKAGYCPEGDYPSKLMSVITYNKLHLLDEYAKNAIKAQKSGDGSTLNQANAQGIQDNVANQNTTPISTPPPADGIGGQDDTISELKQIAILLQQLIDVNTQTSINTEEIAKKEFKVDNSNMINNQPDNIFANISKLRNDYRTNELRPQIGHIARGF